MTVSVLAAARHLGEASGWTLSNLQLQKLIYLAHMVHLGEHGEHLVPGQFEAWDYGPVHPVLYRVARIFGSDPVQNIFHGAAPLKAGSSERKTLDDAYESLGGLSAAQLVDITHKRSGAWYKNYAPGMRHIPIPDADVLEEYRKLAA